MMRCCENVLRTLFAILREIFDESAYSRFLRRRSLPASKEAYAEFIREHGRSKSSLPRCC